jgi:hypothetical protein
MPAIGTPIALPELNLQPEQAGAVQLSEDMQQTLAMLAGFWLNKRVLVRVSPTGMVYVTDPPISDVYHVTATGTAYTCKGDDKPCSVALVIAHPSNTGKVWVRPNDTATVDNAIPLDAGDAVPISITNLNQLQLLIAVSGEKAIVAYSL